MEEAKAYTAHEDLPVGSRPPLCPDKTPQEPTLGSPTGGSAYSWRLWELCRTITPIGCYVFGGPPAIAVLHEQFVMKHSWITDQEFMDLLALGNVLPGPNTSMMVAALGGYRAGAAGALVAFLSWNVPSLAYAVPAGLGMARLSKNGKSPDWLAGLAPAAVALIFVGVMRLSRTVVRTPLELAITLLTAAVALIVLNDLRVDFRTTMWLLPLLLVIGGVLTLLQEACFKLKPKLLRRDSNSTSTSSSSASDGDDDLEAGDADVDADEDADAALEPKHGQDHDQDLPRHVPIPTWVSLLSLALAIGPVLLFMRWSTLAQGAPMPPLEEFFGTFFVVGGTVYGGGQVILPILMNVCVKPGWVSTSQFMDGFALIQMLPGPLYNIAAYLGAVYKGLPGAALGWAGLNFPGVLLMIGLLPLWERVRRFKAVKVMVRGVNCGALGLILFVGITFFTKAVRMCSDAVVMMLTVGLVGWLQGSCFKAMLVGALVGFLLSPMCLNIGQRPLHRE